MRTEWGVCKTAVFYSDDKGLEAASVAVLRVERIPDVPRLLLLRGDKMRESRGARNKVGKGEQNLLGNEGRRR